MKLNVEVTERDIAWGAPGDPSLCPIALTIEEALPGSRPSVASVTVLTVNGCRFKVALAEDVLDQIKSFDTNLGMVPFGFTLEVE